MIDTERKMLAHFSRQVTTIQIQKSHKLRFDCWAVLAERDQKSKQDDKEGGESKLFSEPCMISSCALKLGLLQAKKLAGLVSFSKALWYEHLENCCTFATNKKRTCKFSLWLRGPLEKTECEEANMREQSFLRNIVSRALCVRHDLAVSALTTIWCKI